MVDKKVIYIVWMKYHRRPHTLSKDVLNAKLYFLGYRLGKSRFWRPMEYAIKGIHMFRILVRERPDLVFVQSPPSVCPVFIAIYSIIFKTPYVIDAHTSAITSFWFSLPLAKWAMRRAALVLVHNHLLQELAKSYGIRTLVLEDKLPNFGSQRSFPAPKRSFNFAVLSSLAMRMESSAIQVVIQVARTLKNANFFFTGNLGNDMEGQKPENVYFVGYLPEEEYIALLSSVDGVIALEDRRDRKFVQSCRAIEAISLEKPAIVTDSPVSRELFPKGVIFVENNYESVYSACTKLMNRIDAYVSDIKELRVLFQLRWEKHFEMILEALNTIS